MPSLSKVLLLIAFWGAYVLAPAALPTSVMPSLSPPSHGSEAKKPMSQGAEITKANWRQHPKIKAVRAIVSSVNARMRKGTFKTSERRFESCGDQYFTLRRVARDSKGVAVWYEEYSEGEDASFDFNHYYDRAGRLRFVIAFARAANGTREQHRIYFEETGKRSGKIISASKGPGVQAVFWTLTLMGG